MLDGEEIWLQDSILGKTGKGGINRFLGISVVQSSLPPSDPRPPFCLRRSPALPRPFPFLPSISPLPPFLLLLLLLLLLVIGLFTSCGHRHPPGQAHLPSHQASDLVALPPTGPAAVAVVGAGAGQKAPLPPPSPPGPAVPPAHQVHGRAKTPH